MSDKELGLLLINANYITQQDILSSLQNHFLGVLNRLFTWMEGLFRFETDVLPPNDKITVRVNLENIILEGTRKLRELEQLQDEIPSLDMALKFTDRPGANLRNVNLSVEEWKVVSYINPKKLNAPDCPGYPPERPGNPPDSLQLAASRACRASPPGRRSPRTGSPSPAGPEGNRCGTEVSHQPDHQPDPFVMTPAEAISRLSTHLYTSVRAAYYANS
jgi:hypothetical protein